MRGLDPEEDTSSPAPSTQAVDASSSPVHDAWSKWTSSPANNAALLQFGIAMMQPHAPGQTGLGAAANAIAEGGGAAERVNAQEEASQKNQADIADKESQAAGRNTHGQAELINANAYKKGIDNTVANPKGGGMTSDMRAQNTLRAWSLKPEDPLSIAMNEGKSNDPIVLALQRNHPEIKTKQDILGNTAYMLEAKRMLSQQESAIEPDPGSAPSSGSAAPPAAAAPQVQSFVNKKTGKSEPFALINGKWVKQ